jgi:diacylglycerol kinase family enzyme
MVTNGGIGVPAQTAQSANIFREWVRTKASDEGLPPLAKSVFQIGRRLIELAGSKIYELILLREVTQWDHSSWEVEIEVPGKTQFETQAPFILINNQPSIGGKFRTAPFTNNSDGTFNILLVKPKEIVKQTRAVLGIRMGRIPDVGPYESFETEWVRFKAKDKSRPFIFFGDGEILHREVREIEVRCIHPGLELTTHGELN